MFRSISRRKKRDFVSSLFLQSASITYMERLTDELISIGFEVELIVTPIMARLRHPDSGRGALEDDDGISTPTYFHSTLPIQEEYRPDHRFLEVKTFQASAFACRKPIRSRGKGNAGVSGLDCPWASIVEAFITRRG